MKENQIVSSYTCKFCAEATVTVTSSMQNFFINEFTSLPTSLFEAKQTVSEQIHPYVSILLIVDGGWHG